MSDHEGAVTVDSDGGSATNLFDVTGHSTFTNPGLAVGNAAGVTGGTPPGSLFSVYGFNLATGQAQPTSFPLPLTDASASVLVPPLIAVSMPMRCASTPKMGSTATAPLVLA